VNRILPPLSLALLISTGMLNHVGSCFAMYLRAHKSEPFLGLSLLGAVLASACAYFLGRPFGAEGIAVGTFLLALCIGAPLSAYVFFTNRRRWHGEPSQEAT